VGQAIVFRGLSFMLLYRRRLPHWIPDHAAVFITWRLAGSLPLSAPEILTAENTGRTSFRHYDEPLDHCYSGPFWLQDPRIATLLAEALRYGEITREWYLLHAWVIMPDHVHVVLEPHKPLPGIMCWLKGRTSRVANQLLGRTGLSFWQDESYDHWVRSAAELREAIMYVESNPVKAGLAGTAEQWPWSSAANRR
jgi:REP element-mobilizing transposase RayT